MPDDQAAASAAPGIADGLSLTAFRATRFALADGRLGAVLCPPYDVIDAAERDRLLQQDSCNAVRLVLPVRPGDEPTPAAYADADDTMRTWVDDGVLAVDESATLYVYEITEPDGTVMRGLLGAVELRDPVDGVILPHENTMAGPVADRLALMDATDADLEPIYLVYDGGGAASRVVAEVDPAAAVADARTPDGVRHRLWAVTDPSTIAAVEQDLGHRRALIADGHHRYATYRELQAQRRARHGAGPWDRGLALVVDTSTYGPSVHPIHRVLTGVRFDDALAALPPAWPCHGGLSPADALQELDHAPTALFAAVLTDGEQAAVIGAAPGELVDRSRQPGEPDALADLDITVLHRVLVSQVWRMPDDVDHVGYAHSVSEAIELARAGGGTAVLVRATPVAAVAAVAAAGARMPRKSTLFTPKPASGLVIRRFVDDE